MTPSDQTFSRSYRPWGQVRRKNLIARVLYGMLMTVLGLGIIAAIVLLAIFAGAVLLAAAGAFAVMALVAAVRRKPVRIFVRSEDPKGVLKARRDGSTWTVY